MADGEEHIERLTALLVRQSEMAAQAQQEAALRDERLAAMFERVMTRERPASSPPAAGTNAVVPSTDSAVPARRLPAGALNAPRLTSAASLREFGVWKKKMEDFQLLARLDSLPVKEQRAVLTSLLDDDWSRIVRYNLHVATDAGIEDMLKAMEKHLRSQRIVLLDRREFYSRVQEPDESFDDFLCAVKEIAAYCDFCDVCEDSQFRDRIVAGTRDEEALKRMLLESDLDLQRAVDIC